jgi:hypothetical protein
MCDIHVCYGKTTVDDIRSTSMISQEMPEELRSMEFNSTESGKTERQQDHSLIFEHISEGSGEVHRNLWMYYYYNQKENKMYMTSSWCQADITKV